MKVFGADELREDVLKSGICINCGACVNLCPYFTTHRGKTAMFFPCTRKTGRCHAFCPKTEVDMDEIALAFSGTGYTGDPLGSYLGIYTAKAGERAGRGNFQDGGTVSALMRYALESNKIDAAVLTGKDGPIPVPGLVTQPQEVAGFAASKYTAAPTLAALNEGFRQGYKRMGVVATPCQLTAIAQMRMNPIQKAGLVDSVALTVGLFCTWALDARKFIAFVQEHISGQSIRKMHISPPPSALLVLETETGSIDIPVGEIRSMVLPGCRVCPDMTAEWADLSVGAIEGRDGWNTLITRSQSGDRLVRYAVEAGYLVLDDYPETSMKNLEVAAAAKKASAFETACRADRVNTGEERRSAMRVNRAALDRMIAGKGVRND